MQLKLNESICEFQAGKVEKELADSQIEGAMKREKESQESVHDIGFSCSNFTRKEAKDSENTKI
jgi:hypothetical protein